MKYIKIFLVACLICTAISSLQAQVYDITVNIREQPDSMLIMGNFYGDRTYIKDTAFSTNGKYVFQGAQPLENGMYFIAAGKTRIFDFVIFNDQKFTLSTKAPDYLANMEVEGSDDNKLFVEDMRFNQGLNTRAEPFMRILQDSTTSDAARAEAQAGMSELNMIVQKHQNDIISKNPESFLSKVFNAQKKPDVQEDDAENAILNYRDHYWDHFDLSDPMFLRLNLPLFREKVDYFLDRLFVQHPDSLKPAIDLLAQKASANQDTYKYLVWMLTLKYQNPSIMGLDALFVYINDTFYASGKMDYWANAQLKKNLEEYAGQLRRSLIGETAPDLIMLDQDLQPQRLYNIRNKFTLIYFFDPDCSHCKKATPVLDDIYDSKKFDLEVYAVSIDTSMTKMKEYIREMELDWITVNGPRTQTEPYYTLYDAMTTPTIYILDEKKKVIAKKLPYSRVEEFLMRYSEEQPD